MCVTDDLLARLRLLLNGKVEDEGERYRALVDAVVYLCVESGADGVDVAAAAVASCQAYARHWEPLGDDDHVVIRRAKLRRMTPVAQAFAPPNPWGVLEDTDPD